MRAILAACTHVARTTIIKEVEIDTQKDLFWFLGSVLPDFKEVTWQGVAIIIFYDELAETKPNRGRLVNGVNDPLYGNLVIMGAEEELDPMFTTETIQNYITGVMFETSRNNMVESKLLTTKGLKNGNTETITHAGENFT